MKVYGPYRRKDGRQHVILCDENGKRVTQSYPRFLMEQHLGRKLLDSEEVDHINNDPTDDRIENFQLLSRADNNRKAVRANGREAKYLTFTCPTCGISFEILANRYQGNQIVQKKRGPFCSKSCAGKMIH